MDFGLAEIAAPEQGEDHDVAVDRTVDYAGLEKATAVKHGDIRSDIYFMGCVFYEMLTGHAPLTQTRDRVARMHRHRFENIPPIASYGVELPPSVQSLLDRMLAFDPKAAVSDAGRLARGRPEGSGRTRGRSDPPDVPGRAEVGLRRRRKPEVSGRVPRSFLEERLPRPAVGRPAPGGPSATRSSRTTP